MLEEDERMKKEVDDNEEVERLMEMVGTRQRLGEELDGRGGTREEVDRTSLEG